MVLKYTIAWVPLLVLAVLNGAAREKLYGPYLSERTAHQVSSVTAILLFTFFTAWLGSIWPLASTGEALLVGLVWLCLTMAFEFTMVCLIQKMPMSAALAEYNLKAGRLWPLVLLSVALLPWGVYVLGPQG